MEELKQQAAAKALEYVESGMALGLGSGSTSRYFVDLLGKKLAAGELQNIVGVPTSEATAKQARELNIPLTTLEEHPALDLAIDGADEVDPKVNLVKGWGRALLREKIVESRARDFIVIVDESKLVDKLGTRDFVPVEVVQFAAGAHVEWLSKVTDCDRAELWLEDNGKPVVTDNGNYLVKCYFDNGIDHLEELWTLLNNHPGIVEHGLFLNMATKVIVAAESGLREIDTNWKVPRA